MDAGGISISREPAFTLGGKVERNLRAGGVRGFPVFTGGTYVYLPGSYWYSSPQKET